MAKTKIPKIENHHLVVTHKEILAFDDHRVYATGEHGKIIFIFKNKESFDTIQQGQWIDVTINKV